MDNRIKITITHADDNSMEMLATWCMQYCQKTELTHILCNRKEDGSYFYTASFILQTEKPNEAITEIENALSFARCFAPGMVCTAETQTEADGMAEFLNALKEGMEE